MRILLTNDDGIHAPGLAAMRRALAPLGEVMVVAPATEQSGVGHSITFLTPLMASEIHEDDRLHEGQLHGWAVEGSPADCVKLAIAKLCRDDDGNAWVPDLVVSGINRGLNAGVNVLYSGTVAAATEGALNGLPSIAVSLEFADRPRFEKAADQTAAVITQMLKQNAWQEHLLYNLNIPTSATLDGVKPELRIGRMASTRWDAAFEERQDPMGRRYFWTTGVPQVASAEAQTDVAALRSGAISLTPLTVVRTDEEQLNKMSTWSFGKWPLSKPAAHA